MGGAPTPAGVKEVALGAAAAAPAAEEAWIPICKPEDMPKGARCALPRRRAPVVCRRRQPPASRSRQAASCTAFGGARCMRRAATRAAGAAGATAAAPARRAPHNRAACELLALEPAQQLAGSS